MEVAATVGHLASVNDIEMYYELRGDGEPLVLLHGGGGIGANWNLIFKGPVPDYRMVMPDLRGHGKTTNPSGVFSFKQLAFDVYALLDRLGIRQFKAIGMSMGAKTLLHMATQQPDRIEAMVLVSATPYFPQQARDAMSLMTPEHRTDAEWSQMRQWHQQGDDQILSIWKTMNALKDSFDDMNFTAPYLSTITARTLIVHGDRDPLYPVNVAFEMYDAIPNSHLWVVPNGGHGPIFREYSGNGETTVHFAETALRFLGDNRQGE